MITLVIREGTKLELRDCRARIDLASHPYVLCSTVQFVILHGRATFVWMSIEHGSPTWRMEEGVCSKHTLETIMRGSKSSSMKDGVMTSYLGIKPPAS